MEVFNIGTKERKQRELAKRKQLILDKSKELFFLKGFRNVSIQDICDAVEYGRSTVYSLFESKEEIYGYVYVEAVKILGDLINTVDISTADPGRTYLIFTEQVFRFYHEYNPYYKALLFFDYNHVAHTKIPEYLLKMKLKEKERCVAPVRELLKRGIKEGILRDFDIDYVIDTYFASQVGIINMFVIEKHNVEPDKLRDILLKHAEIFGRGLLA